MYKVPLENPQPNIDNFIKIIKGEFIPSRGVDLNVLATYQENKLRKYVRNILINCMAKGKYALGSGNSITNYIPVKNYLIMLEEGLNFEIS